MEEKIIDQTELHAQAAQKKELKHLGSIRLRPGMKLWQYNTKTHVIEEAQYETIHTVSKGAVKVTKKLVVKEDCIYDVAINAANMDYKMMRRLGLSVPRPGKLKKKR